MFVPQKDFWAHLISTKKCLFLVECLIILEVVFYYVHVLQFGLLQRRSWILWKQIHISLKKVNRTRAALQKSITFALCPELIMNVIFLIITSHMDTETAKKKIQHQSICITLALRVIICLFVHCFKNYWPSKWISLLSESGQDRPQQPRGFRKWINI